MFEDDRVADYEDVSHENVSAACLPAPITVSCMKGGLGSSTWF